MSRREICAVLQRDTDVKALLTHADGFENDYERRVFDYFRSETAPKSTTFFGSEFWGGIVLQLSHLEPAIKYAVLALSSLDQQLQLDCHPGQTERKIFALRSYDNAVKHTNTLLSRTGQDELEKGLIACAIFVCYENLRGCYDVAQMHLQNGLRILSEFRTRRQSRGGSSHDIPDDLLQVFSRLDIQAMAFSESRAPYPFLDSLQFSLEPAPIPAQFHTAGQAQHCLLEIFKEIFRTTEILHSTIESLGDEKFKAEQSKTNSNIARWDAAFQSFLDSHRFGEHATTETLRSLTFIQVYRCMVSIVVDYGNSGLEIFYDSQMSRFEEILNLIESLVTVLPYSRNVDDNLFASKTFSFELGIVIPLYYMAGKCRDPILRRRGISLLKSANRREGAWDSFGAARVAETLVAIEEEGLRNVQCAADIEEYRRIHDVYIEVDIELEEARLVCPVGPGPVGLRVERKAVVRF